MAFTSEEQLINYLLTHPELEQQFYNQYSNSSYGQKLIQRYELMKEYQGLMNGQGDANHFLGQAANLGVELNPEMEKYVNNLISQQNTQTERDFQTEMRNTSLLSTGSQLQQLGLSSSGVLSLGGASSGVTTNAASTDTHSGYSVRQQKKINDYNQKMSMAKSIINMTTALGAAGIYGHSLVAAKKAAATLSASTAHSGISALKAVAYPQKGNYGDFYKEFPLPQQEGYSFLR